MTRKDVLRTQILAGVFVVVMAVLAIGINGFLRTFPHEIPLGKLVVASINTSGPSALQWDDAESLAKIQAALPKWRVGAGYPAEVHSHESLSLTLRDDKGKQVSLLLPVDESSLVVVHTNLPDYTSGDSWDMPELLGVLGTLGKEKLAKLPPSADSLGPNQIDYWVKHYANQK